MTTTHTPGTEAPRAGRPVAGHLAQGVTVANPDQGGSTMKITVTPAIELDATDLDTAVETYRAASTGDKTKIRNAVQSAMMDAVRAMDLKTAQACQKLADALSAAKPAAPEVDLNQVVADRIIALQYAAHRLLMGDVAPEGMDEDKLDTDKIAELVAAYRDGGDPDAVSNEVAEAGTKIARTKITRSTERGSVEAAIETAFADMPIGTKLTVRQIAVASGAKSDGAIAARVWPVDRKNNNAPKESTLDFQALGVQPTEVNGVRAIEKVA